MHSDTPNERLQKLANLSSLMVEAARRSDWVRLRYLGKRCAMLKSSPAPAHHGGGYGLEPNLEQLHLIQLILGNDAEVRRYTEPWMECLQNYMDMSPQRLRVLRLANEAPTADEN